jgi:hypothetical protein
MLKLIPEHVAYAYPERPLIWEAPQMQERWGLPEPLKAAPSMGIAAADVRKRNYMPRGLFFSQREVVERAAPGYGGYFDDARRSTRTRRGYVGR